MDHTRLEIVRGTCFPTFAFEVAQAVDLDLAERRLAAGTERQTVKQKRRAPAHFEYQPRPLRVTRPAATIAVGPAATNPWVELVLYDFGAVSISYAIPLSGSLDDQAHLSAALWGNTELVADARRHVEAMLATIGDAAARPRIADFVEDYAIFCVEAFTGCEASRLAVDHGPAIARILRSEARSLSEQEIADATSGHLSFSMDDATFIDMDTALIVDAEGNDVRWVLEYANTQLLEMRFLDTQLDESLDRTYEILSRRGRGPGLTAGDLGRLAARQLDGALLFEQVTNALKLVGEQYLARVYSLASKRFHLASWDASISRKLATLDGIYGKFTNRAATRRMEVLEWIIIALILLETLLSLATPLRGR